MRIHFAYAAIFIFIFPASPASYVHAAEGFCSLKDGIKADGKTVLEHGGTKHEFCCSGCLDKFKANPGHFLQETGQPAPANAEGAEAACSSVCGE